MVLTFLAGFAAVFGTSEGIRAAQSKSKKEEHRTRKNNLVVHCPRGSKYSSLLEGRRIVLAGDKLYVDTGTEYNVPFGHPFEGYYLPYPAQRYSGLVSTITHEAPIMNWVFVHKDTYEIKFGNRQASEGNLTGPWDCTRQDRRLTFGGWEGFVAVREGNFWALYFDRDGDRLKDKVEPGTPVIELELLRREMRAPRPVVVQPELTEEQLKLAQEQAALQAQQQAEEAARLAAQEQALREALSRAQEEASRKEKETAEAAAAKKQQQKSEAQAQAQPRNSEESQQQPQPQNRNGGKQKELQSPRSPSRHGPRQTNSQNKNQKRGPSINLPLPSPNPLAASSGTQSTKDTISGNRVNKTSNGRGPNGSRNPDGSPNRNGLNGANGANGTSGRAGVKDADGASDTSSNRSSDGRKRRSRRRPRRRKNSVSSPSPEQVASDVDRAPTGLQTPPSSIYPSEEDLPPSPPVD